MEKIIITEDNSSKLEKRAKMLAKSISNAKILGKTIMPHEPIEGKIFC
ncbi:hypothetical protein ACFLSE_02220 [Bacteroidota bacterium]